MPILTRWAAGLLRAKSLPAAMPEELVHLYARHVGGHVATLEYLAAVREWASGYAVTVRHAEPLARLVGALVGVA